MGRKPRPVGAATLYVAQELRAQRARLEWSLDTLAEKSGVPRSTAHRALAGERAVDIEAVVAMSAAMGLDAGKLLSDAQRHANKSH